MRSICLKATLKTAVLAVMILLLGAGVSLAQQQINLTAGPATLTLPDGSLVPMWGYSCGAVVSGSTATCAKLNPTAAGWSPIAITVPTGQGLQINLTNSLSFTPGQIPTSLVIVGQLGGGLGNSATSTSSPAHGTQTATWPIAGAGANNPPPQPNRVQSFSTEVGVGATTSLTWTAPRPGTYLIESGTHPSIQGPMGLYGILVVTSAPSGTTAGTAYPGVTYNAEVPLLLSEIDPVQNNAVNTAVNTAGFTEAAVWSGLPGGCGNPNSPVGVKNTCYPPAVNYTPLYYLINGAAFDKTHAANSLISATPAAVVAGNVLVRFVNAGLRMHVPSIVGGHTGTPAVPGFGLIAEDGNPIPGVTRVQNEVFLAAGKTYDVMINVPAAGVTALPVFDRQLSLSGNAISRDAGMLAYLSINAAGLPTDPAFTAAVARADTYPSVIPGQTLTISDPSKGVIANDTNVYGVKVLTPPNPAKGTLTLNANGTFSYVAAAGWSGGDSFTYCANGTTTVCATVTLGAAPIEAATGITCTPAPAFTANVGTYLAVKTPGLLASCKDAAGYPLKVATSTVTPGAGLTSVLADVNGGFTANAAASGTHTFTFKAQNSQGTLSAAVTATVVFPAGSGLAVKVLWGEDKTTLVTDYRWIIEEDRTFYVDPTKTTNTGGSTIVPTFGTNFHTSFMPIVATGCTGPLSCESGQTVLGAAAVCDLGNGNCRTTATQQTPVNPSQVVLDPTKRYYISVLPGDAANPFNTANAVKGHGMGGAQIAAGQLAVSVLVQPTPFPPSKLSVFVFEDDFPLNGENDAGGAAAIDTVAPNEPGLGGFNITLFDDAGGSGDATGQPTYDMFNMPLSNALAGTIDPLTGKNACPISSKELVGSDGTTASPTGITGMIVTCPKYESDGTTLSPLAGQAVVANLYPGRYGVVATPAADRIGRGEEWLQTNTLDGQKAHDSFLRIGGPAYFQEFGPSGYHVSIGFANPAIINARKAGVCGGSDPNLPGVGNCVNTISGTVTTERMSRTPDERLYSSGDNSSFSFTQCYVSFGDADGEDFAFTKCDANGNFSLSGLPDGDWRVTVFDQWNDMLVDGLSTPVRLDHTNPTSGQLGQIATNQWQANIYTSTFFDTNGNGVRDNNEAGLSLVATNIRFRDGSFSNFNNTDLSGNAGFNEIFPLFSWYVVETDTTRYKNTGTHVVYDSGGPADGSPSCGQTGYPPCGTANIGQFLANTAETVPLPTNLRVPGAYYCSTADCGGAPGPVAPGGPGGSTGRVDPPWVVSEGWQGFSGQNSFIEFGKKPYGIGENGGILGHVVYASTRPFDDPQLLLQTSWEPLVPNVTINLYQEGTAPDGSQSLKLVDHTQTSSFDNWAQGFLSNGVPNMNCPGQATTDLFFFSLYNQPNYLDVYNAAHGGPAAHTLPNNSQFKCYDGMHNWNQVQPAPYDGKYQFPSVTGLNLTTGKPNATNCTICAPNHAAAPTDWNYGLPMLPSGKYVVEVVVPPGYELVKEEDKNILIGDNYIAPVTQQFAGLGNIFILPDQAEIGASSNANNPQNSTQNLGRFENLPSHEGDTGSVETFWPCVGESRVVPDYISLFPQSAEVAPFAGATRNLCDRKEVTLEDQTSALAKFYIFTSTHAAAHFTGIITDDYTSEFDPFSPQFGEKFSPPDLPVSLKDWTGNEISRVYADHWGAYNGLTYSTWEVNPPNPTGYAPTMMITCMNDPGPILDPSGSGKMITDPLFTSGYSQFCYDIPFMPGQTQYMDTPVVPTAAFAGAGYNNVDCSYPDATPAISEVDGDGVGPWVSAVGHTIRVTALGDQSVPNYAYSGPSATLPPFNQKTITRHYGFGGTKGTVSVGGVTVPAASVTWSDTAISFPAPAGVPACTIQQRAVYGGSNAQCGQLSITAANGKQSVDTVTVTIGGKAPTHVAASASIQSAIDAANPGDLIIVDPTCSTTGGPAACAPTGVNKTTAAHNELLLMWKPVRLQGVGAATSIINANTFPAGKLTPWRQQVNCLFGLTPSGSPTGYDPTCGSGWTNFHPTQFNPQVDRLPLEATVGWDATLNGNLAELLQEPSLMGALEGAAITVLSKGVYFPADPYDPTLLAGFPAGTVLFLPTNTSTYCNGTYPSNFQCNPASIDGLGITDSSQGGGGIFVHGWGHNLQIANNRLYNNAGTLSGGINVGQGEFPPPYIQGSATNAAPGSCQSSPTNGVVLPYCHNVSVNVHNNNVSLNSSTGDELFSATPAGAGGVSFCTGSDYYNFNNNWVCGNLSSGDGGGLGHLGLSYNGTIAHNSILFNQSTNPTITSNGGGIIVMGAPDADPPCSALTDADCVSPPGTIGPSDGTGPGLVINANLIMGNSAESGSGGGIALQQVNGTDVVTFPTTPAQWYSPQVINNIIADNVAGWDGAGISLLDALNVNIVNNTIMSNVSTASAGVLFDTIGAPLASTQGKNCAQNNATTSCPQPAGLVSIQNSAILGANLPATVTCPAGHYAPNLPSPNNATCRQASYPLLANNMVWQNSTYYIGVGALSPAFQQHVVALFNSFTGTAAANQTTTGSCPAGASYWDIGVRGDTGPGNHASTITLAPTYSVLTNASENGLGTNNLNATNPNVIHQYCDGSRQPPEGCGPNACGWAVPPGISDATVPNPIFNLTPVATVDEGNNWINMRWGPLSMVNPVTGVPLGNFVPAAGSPAIDAIPTSSPTYALAPSTDFFGHPRPDAPGTPIDYGAVETGGTGVSIAPTALNFPNQLINPVNTPLPLILTISNYSNVNVAIVSYIFSGPNASEFTQLNTCSASRVLANSSCTVSVRFRPTAVGLRTATLTITLGGGNPPLVVSLSGTGVAPSAVLSPTLLTFPATTVGVLSAPLSVTLTNNGLGLLNGLTYTFTGANAADFTQNNNCSGGQLAPTASCTILVRFRPGAVGARSAILTVRGSDPNLGNQPVTLNGTGR